MKYKGFVIGLAIIGLANTFPLRSVSAQEVWQGKPENCTLGARTTPAKENKEIINKEFGFSFKIPSNYTVEVASAKNLSSQEKLRLSLLNPVDISFAACSKKNRIRGWGHALLPILVSVEAVPNDVQSIKDLPKPFKGIQTTVIARKEITVGRQPAVIFVTQSIYPSRSLISYIFMPDSRNLIVVSTGAYGEKIDRTEKEVLNRVLSSLSFSN